MARRKMAITGDPPIHCPKCGQVHRRGFIVCEPFNERQGKPVGYEDDNDPRWPARCRGYLEGKRASDCLANVELARLRAENERLTELNDQFGLTIFDNRVELDHLYVDVAECKRLRAEWARASRRVGVLEKLLEAPRRHTSYRLDGKQVNKLLAAGLITAAQHKEIKAKTGHTAAKRIWRAGFETGLAAAALKGEP